ncbi:hypothetical protein JVU11DRAFT_9950 [Chiua virens]|nr:hypothetical protein JVU11DRAFT_9950 [Chiua virens]
MALKACARLRQILDARWEQPNAPPPFRNPSQDELARDSCVSFLNSAEYIRNALSNPGYKSVGTPFNPNQRRRGTIDDFLSSDGTFFEESYRADLDVTLFDIERLVGQEIDDWVARVTNVGEACSQLEILMDKYAELSMSSTNGESERDFIQLLTGIELFLAVDKLVIREIPLLADYSPAIPITYLEAFFLRTTTSLHRLSRVYQYFSARHSFSRSGWSVFSNEFTEDSLPVRYYDQSPHLRHLKAQIEGDTMHTTIGHMHHQGGNELSRSPLPVSSLQAKVVVFELQCPAHIRIWRSAAFRVLNWLVHLMGGHLWMVEQGENLLARSIELQPYFSGHDGPPLHYQIHFSYFYPRGSQSRNIPTLRYVLQRGNSSIYSKFIVCKSGMDTFGLEDRPSRFNSNYTSLGWDDSLSNYINDTSCTPNNVLAAQVHCPTDFSVEEFTAFAQLRSGGSLQWLNILHGLRSRTLNLRRHKVHFLLSRAVFQVGPLDLNTGVWIWHQELENVSFCNALMDELYALFVDFGAESIDAIVMGSMSLLLTRILASSPSERVSERAIHLLRDIRSKTLLWVEELSYNLAMAPTNTERSRLLLEMAATCRSTFDVDPACLPKLFRSAEDVDATLSCALFICSLRPEELEFQEPLNHYDPHRLSPVFAGTAVICCIAHYGLSFFVNAHGELESRDFRDMVYDDNQSIGALFGLKNLLVLRPKLVIAGTLLPEALIPRRILVPDGIPTQYGVHYVQVEPSVSRELVGLFCHVYDVDPELGCLIGNGSLTSTQYLALLHAATSCDRPDPLTSKTGAQVAYGLLRCGGCQSVGTRLRDFDTDKFLTSSIHYYDYPQIDTQYPQLAATRREILLRYYWTGCGNHVNTSLKRSVQRAAHLFPSKVTGPNHWEDCNDADYSEIDTDLELQDLVSTAASVIYTWSVSAPTITPLINWQQLWHANVRGGKKSDITLWTRYTVTVHPDPGLVQRLITKVQGILGTSEEYRPRFQLLFLLPTTAYCSPCYPAAFLSMLIAFANLSTPCLRDLPVHTDCDLLDGWRPTERILYNLVNNSGWSGTKDELFVAAMDLLKGWPRKTPPPISLDPCTYNVKTLAASLQPMFSSCFHNFVLKKNLMDILAESRSECILQVAPRPISLLRNMPRDSECTQWQVTLEQLLADRLPPTLPSRNHLPCDSHWHKPASEGNERLADDVLKLESQIFSSVLMDHPFQQEYLTHLHASSQRICDEYLVTRVRTAGGGLIEAFRNHYVLCKANYVRGLAALKQALIPPTDALAQALSQFWYNGHRLHSSVLEKCLISFALLLLDLQRSRRLLRLALYGLEEELAKELENAPCDGWKPEEYPDWLLIQIQGNFTIRHAQAETAMEIMSPQSGENTVMQVNMGEGKSSVIIPIAAAALADGKQLVRIIVPRALTVQMFDILVSRLGGLTNRPIYHLPFSRNLEYDEDNQVISLQVDDLQKLMSRCMAEHGILLLQPEHVVSLRLMSMEEQIRKGKVAAERWSRLQKWIHIHCRDILDESDEILHTRFQLIYTIGPQQHMDGYPHRWTIMQQVLQLVKEHAYSLSMYSPLAMEYEGGPQASFPYIHILRASDIGRSLVSFIAEDVMAGRIPGFNFQHASPPLHDAIHSFIFDDVLRLPDTAEKVEEYAKNSHQSYLWSGLLLLRGLLASNILVFALSEWRWRVNYGLQVHPTRIGGHDHRSRLKASTMLAVPYRAKDTPAPNTQFGHPDITIILTCLSYYYTGLTEDQLRTSFEILLDEDDPSTEYARWVKGYTGMLPNSLQELGEINLRSSEQWDKVTFPLFTRNQATIDFYLSRVVFPKEAKEFPWKLSSSSWDLAEKREKLVTGFSGTNDNRWLLPTSIAQHDLEHQKGTNARILGYLLRPENDFYEVTYESGGRRSTRKFLRTVVDHEHEIRVLLDVGAQILDLSNQEVARAWLDIARHISGAIYFNEKDELMVLTQEGTTLPLLSSPLSQTLDRCVVYLDHAHTRGTDLKFPNGSRAAVTLGPKVTKDNLVQGCMRMRKLGHGHSVMFFAPPDVDRTIRAVTGKKDPAIQVTTADVLSLSNAWLQPEGKSLVELYGPSNTDDSSSTLSALDPGIRQRCEALGVLSFPSAQLDEEQEREVNREREREREVELPPEAEPAEHSIHPDVETFVKTGIIPPLHSGSAFQPVFTSLKKSTAATRDADVWSPFILATTDFCRTIKPESTHGTMDQYLRPVQRENAAAATTDQRSQQTPYDVPSEAIRPSSSDMECDNIEDDNSVSSVFLSSTRKLKLDATEPDDSNAGTESLKKRPRAY